MIYKKSQDIYLAAFFTTPFKTPLSFAQPFKSAGDSRYLCFYAIFVYSYDCMFSPLWRNSLNQVLCVLNRQVI